MTQAHDLSPSRFAANSKKKRQRLSVKFAITDGDEEDDFVPPATQHQPEDSR